MAGAAGVVAWRVAAVLVGEALEGTFGALVNVYAAGVWCKLIPFGALRKQQQRGGEKIREEERGEERRRKEEKRGRVRE